MDESPAPLQRLTDRLRSLTETQRLLLPVAAVVVAGGLWIATRRTSTDAILPLPADVLPAAALAHLQERGLTGAHLDEAGRITLPAARADEAARWIEELAESPVSWADEWEKSNSQLGQFSGSRERDVAREITRSRVIGRLLRQMPDIAQADVIWDEEESSGWRQPKRTRCTVYLRPKSGCEITPDVARAVRQAVAGSKKNLATEDIVVMDLARMTTFDAVPQGVEEFQRQTAERQVADVRRDIERALGGCPDVRVSVGVAWNKEEQDESTVSLAPERTLNGAGPWSMNQSVAGRIGSLVSDREPMDPSFTPSLQVTVSAPKAAAEQWATQSEGMGSTEMETSRADVIPVSFTATSPTKSTSAAASIRRHVASVLNRNGQSRVPAAVAVHLIPGAKSPGPLLRDSTHEHSLDPAWFFGLTAAGCLGGAWLLSRMFQAAESMQPSIADPLAEYGDDVRRASLDNFPEVSEPFEFEALIHSPAAMWPRLWQAIPGDDWIAALKGASLQLRRTVLASLDEHSAADLQAALEQSPPPRLSDIDDCQQRILVAARALAQTLPA